MPAPTSSWFWAEALLAGPVQMPFQGQFLQPLTPVQGPSAVWQVGTDGLNCISTLTNEPSDSELVGENREMHF